MAKTKSQTNPRAAAALAISDVIRHGRSLNQVLDERFKSLDGSQRSLAQQIVFGVMRSYPALDQLVSALLQRPLKNKDADINALLLTGLYQLRDMRMPAHAALSETVGACRDLGKSWASKLLNGCLRRFQREQADFEHQLNQNESSRYAHPEWLIQLIRADWPEDWAAILEANNQKPPMMLRVNQQQYTRDDYLEKLRQADIEAHPIADTADGLILENACPVTTLPGFSKGSVSVQDGAAQKVADVLSIEPGQRILDACAAPGGKTCHILERMPENTVVALDIDVRRLERIHENTHRLGLSAQLIAADAGDTDAWWDGQLFDRILVDAPCTGTGVIRRHPDIKVLRQPHDVDPLAQRQQVLLQKLWPLLKPGGLMVYTTCSILRQENEQQIEAFLQLQPGAREYLIEPAPARRLDHGYQNLPGEGEMDGFYYACLERIA